MMWISFLLSAALAAAPANLEKLRDLEDRPGLERAVADLSAAAEKASGDADAQYRLALASSYLAEISLELHDKAAAERDSWFRTERHDEKDADRNPGIDAEIKTGVRK